jgi:hypothetical protein
MSFDGRCDDSSVRQQGCTQHGGTEHWGPLPTALQKTGYHGRVVDSRWWGTQVDADTVVDGNVTYYAKWTPGELR